MSYEEEDACMSYEEEGGHHSQLCCEDREEQAPLKQILSARGLITT